MSNQYYNPDELIDYLTTSREQGTTPSFTNRADVLEEEEAENEGKAKSFAVGVRRTPEGRWEAIKKKEDAKSLLNDPVSMLAAERPAAATPLGDAVAKAALQRVSMETKQNAMLAERIGPLDAEIERMGQATSMISSMLINSSNPKTAAKWQARQAQRVEEFNNARVIRDEAMEALKRDPLYDELEQKKLVAKQYEDFYGPVATREAAAKRDMDSRIAIHNQGTALAKKEAADNVSPAETQAAKLVLGVEDDRIAAFRYANEPIDATAKQVISEMAANAETPEMNTPLANMAVPLDKFKWISEAYINSKGMSDMEFRKPAEALIKEMERLKKVEETKMMEYVLDNDSVAFYDDQMAAYKTDTSKKSSEYQNLARGKQAAVQEASKAYFMQRMIVPLKNNLLTYNQDLLLPPRSTTPVEAPIVGPIIEKLTTSKATTWEDAMREVNNEVIPELKSQGYNKEIIQVVKNKVVEQYREAINSRHSLSGVVLTPSDMKVDYSFFEQVFKSNPLGGINFDSYNSNESIAP